VRRLIFFQGKKEKPAEAPSQAPIGGYRMNDTQQGANHE
jgi:hypothetical protein